MDKFKTYWDNICKIYFLTKHYLILSEEISDDFDTFLQPIKEHRDAFDHIARVYGHQLLSSPITDIETYQAENMKKAIGHIYRAFFDTADWLTYICRRKIRETVEKSTYEEIIQIYPDYDDLKKRLTEIPKEIGEIREQKDISDDEKLLVSEVDRYKVILDELIDAYKKISNSFK
jgi:hypothetical protein